MKKLLYLLTLTLFISMISCEENTTTPPVTNTDIIEFVQVTDTIISTAMVPDVHTYAIIKNLTNSDIKVALEIEFTDVVDGHGLSVCIGGQCLAPIFENTLYNESHNLPIVANSQNSEYDAYAAFAYKDIPGTSLFTFRYIPINADGTLNRDASIEYQCVCIR